MYQKTEENKTESKNLHKKAQKKNRQSIRGGVKDKGLWSRGQSVVVLVGYHRRRIIDSICTLNHSIFSSDYFIERFFSLLIFVFHIFHDAN